MSRRKPYVREVPKAWYLKNAFYSKYMLREGSSIFVTAYCIILLFGLGSLVRGPLSWAAWLDGMSSPGAILFHLIALGMTCYHMVTWFSLLPVVMPKQIGKYEVDGPKVIAGNYLATGLLSVIFLMLAYGG